MLDALANHSMAYCSVIEELSSCEIEETESNKNLKSYIFDVGQKNIGIQSLVVLYRGFLQNESNNILWIS